MVFTVGPRPRHEEVEAIILAETERLKRDGVTEAELQAAKVAADAAFKLDGSFGIAGNLNEYISRDDHWTLFYGLDRSGQESHGDELYPARGRIIPDREFQRTTGWFVPTSLARVAQPATKAGHQASARWRSVLLP